MGCKGGGDSWELKRGEIGVEADGVAGLLAWQGGVPCGTVGRGVGRQSTFRKGSFLRYKLKISIASAIWRIRLLRRCISLMYNWWMQG